MVYVIGMVVLYGVADGSAVPSVKTLVVVVERNVVVEKVLSAMSNGLVYS